MAKPPPATHRGRWLQQSAGAGSISQSAARKVPFELPFFFFLLQPLNYFHI